MGPRREEMRICQTAEGKRLRETACTSGFPNGSKALPTVSVMVGGENEVLAMALGDSGCSQTI